MVTEGILEQEHMRSKADYLGLRKGVTKNNPEKNPGPVNCLRKDTAGTSAESMKTLKRVHHQL